MISDSAHEPTLSALGTVSEDAHKYRSLFDSNGMAHSEIEISTGRFTKVNDRFCRMVGYTFDELIGGMTFLDITHPDDRRATREAIQRLCETEANSVELEKRYLRKDGTVLWVRINSTVVRDSKGNPVKILKCAHEIMDRKRAEQVLLEMQEASDRQRRLYEAILTNTPDLAYVFDLNHRFIYANDILLRMWDKTWDEAIGKTCLELGYEPWHAEMHDREIEYVVSTKQSIRGEVPFKGSFGLRIYDYIFVPVLDASGNVEAVAGTTRDITELKIVHESLHASEQRVRLATEAVELGLWVWNLSDGQLMWENDQPYKIFGIDKEQAVISVDAFINDFLLPEYVDQFQSSVRDLDIGFSKFLFTCEIRRPDQSVRWIELNGRPMASEDGSMLMHGTVEDITDKKLAEESSHKVAESNAKFKTLFEQGNLLALVLSVDGTVIEVNRLAIESCGFKREDVIGFPFWDCGWWSPCRDLSASVRAATYQAAQGQIFRSEMKYFVADGSQRFVDLMITPVTDEDGNVLFISPTGTDVTERKALEDQILRQADELAEQSRRKDEFLAMLGHELRNPLAPIRSAVELLKSQDQVGDVAIQGHARAIIERQVDNLTKLVGDLLEVSRVLSGRIRLDLEPLDLKHSIQQALQTTSPLIEQKGHKVIVNLCSEPLWAHADPTRFEEILVNLINNAAKYTPDHGVIHIDCARNQLQGSIRVRDNGVGIDKELLPKIFDLFTQAERSLDRSEGGLGIGLSLARRLVEMHGGSIEVHSPPQDHSEGSEFAVMLPLIEPPKSEDAVPGFEAEPESRDLKVLVVDDNYDLVTVLTYALKAKGYEVHIARNGPDGLAAAQETLPDVVLLDIGLPGISGFDVASGIRATVSKPIRLIALTGYGRDSDIAMAREAGFDGHLTKPFHLHDLDRLMSPT